MMILLTFKVSEEFRSKYIGKATNLICLLEAWQHNIRRPQEVGTPEDVSESYASSSLGSKGPIT